MNHSPAPAPAGAVRLFEFKGIAVFLHWSWFIVAVYEIGERTGTYSSIVWNAAEYIALFGIVTLHEFGHAFACRSVGGRANQIVLWPLGGIAFVEPPPRPGATLWSIAAGPLVNLVLLPVLAGLAMLTSGPPASDAHALLRSIAFINFGLLLFNLLPIYPLDGGQILGALLWFVIGRARSLMVSAVIGFAGVVGLAWLAFSSGSAWLGIMAFFLAGQCLSGFQAARVLSRLADAPRRNGFACPSCYARPPSGAFWRCGACGTAFDVFQPGLQPGVRGSLAFETTTRLDLSAGPPTVSEAMDTPGECPACHEPAAARCPRCGAVGLVADWRAAAAMP